MIDFNNASYLKLRQVPVSHYENAVAALLLPGERLEAAYQSIRDGLVFTDLRIITINVQGVTGKKKDFTSLPYNRIQTFSVETAGVIDLDCELELWFSGLGRVKLEFTRDSDVSALCRLIGSHVFR